MLTGIYLFAFNLKLTIVVRPLEYVVIKLLNVCVVKYILLKISTGDSACIGWNNRVEYASTGERVQ